MAVGILHDEVRGKTVLFCTTSDTAFGPVFESFDEADDFLAWLREDRGASVGWLAEIGDGSDPRDYKASDLEALVETYRSQGTSEPVEPLRWIKLDPWMADLTMQTVDLWAGDPELSVEQRLVEAIRRILQAADDVYGIEVDDVLGRVKR